MGCHLSQLRVQKSRHLADDRQIKLKNEEGVVTNEARNARQKSRHKTAACPRLLRKIPCFVSIVKTRLYQMEHFIHL